MVTREISPADIIDRILDKGVVIDYRGKISVGGIDTLMTVDALYVITSLQSPHNYYEFPFWEAEYHPPPEFFPLPVEPPPPRRRRRRRSKHPRKR